jgi:PKD repeat protein
LLHVSKTILGLSLLIFFFLENRALAQDCEQSCLELYNAQGELVRGTSCQPDFGLKTIGGFACLGEDKCIIFDNTFTINPPETEYVFTWGDGVIDTVTHQQLLNLPEEQTFTGPIRKYCHPYQELTCPDPEATFTIGIDLFNPNGGCTNSIASSEIKVLAPVEVDFEMPEFACINSPVSFFNTSEEGYNSDCTTDANYEWDFDDNGSVEYSHKGKQELNHTFTTPGIKTIKLSGYHDPRSVCGPTTITKTITVLNIPEPQFNIGEGKELQTVTDCDNGNFFVFEPTSNACVEVSLPLENITENRNPTTTFTWSVSPASGASFQNNDLTLDNNVISFNQPGTYKVSLNVSDECADGLSGSNEACINVVVKDKPILEIDVPASICEGNDLPIRVNNWQIYTNEEIFDLQWNVESLSNADVPTFDDSQPETTLENLSAGTYEISLSYDSECGGSSVSPVIVEVLPTPELTIETTIAEVCEGNPLTLNSSLDQAESYKWYENGDLLENETGSSLVIQKNLVGSYEYSLEVVQNGCLVVSEPVIIKVNSIPSANSLEVSQDIFCAQEEVDFSIQANGIQPADASLQWQTCNTCDGTDWQNVPEEDEVIFNGERTGTYRLQIDRSGCIFNTEPVTVEQLPAINPVISIGEDATACAGGGVNLSVSDDPSYTYQWLLEGQSVDGATNATLQANASGNYSVEVMQNSLCSEISDIVEVTINALPEFDYTLEQPNYCTGDNIDISFSSELADLNFFWEAQPSDNLSLPVNSGTGNISLAVENLSSNDQTLVIEVWAENINTGCESSRKSISIPIRPILGLELDQIYETCSGQPIQITIDALADIEQNYEVKLVSSDLGITGANTQSGSIQNGKIIFDQTLVNNSSQTGSAYYEVKAISDLDGVICESDIFSFEIQVKPSPSLVFDTSTADTVLCSGETLNIDFETDVPGANIIYTPLDNPNIIGAESGEGTYIEQSLISTNINAPEILIFQIGIEADGCIGIARNISIIINPVPEIELLATQNDTIVCGPGDFESEITALSSVSASTFQWLDQAGNVISNNEKLTTTNTGTYTVEINTSEGCVASRDVNILRRQLTEPLIKSTGISAPNPLACPGDTVFLTVESTSGQLINDYQWLLDGNAISGATTANYSVTEPGLYSVSVNNTTPCPEVSESFEVAFSPAPEPIIQDLPPAICPGVTSIELTSFNENESANVVSYLWTVTPESYAAFDNATNPNPELLIFDNQTGTDVLLSIGLEMVTDNGCRKVVIENLILSSRPIAGFTVPQEICELAPLNSINQSQFADSYEWSVEPGEGVQIENPESSSPTIVFPENEDKSSVETYVITQKAYRGSCMDVFSQEIIVHPSPQASFEVALDSDNGCGPVEATFDNLSIGAELTYHWDFGNGLTSDQANPPNVVYKPDTITRLYDVKLEVTNSICGMSSYRDTVLVRPIPKVSRVLLPLDKDNSICADFEFGLNYTAVGLPESVDIDFGDGRTLTLMDSTKTVSHTYLNENNRDTTYTLTVVANSECGTDTLKREILVTPNTVDAFYEADTSTVCQFAPITLKSNQYASNSNEIMWVWGDGEITYDSINATHIYKEPGTYYPMLVVRNGCNIDTCSFLTDPSCGIQLKVEEVPEALFNAPDTICISDEVSFVNSSSFQTENFWQFGDGAISDRRNPSHKYTQAGTYTVGLSVENTYGCTNYYEKNITVIPLPVPDFEIATTTYCEEDEIQFSNTSTGATNYTWEIRNTEEDLIYSSNVRDASTIFNEKGEYSVKLKAFNQTGCVDSVSQQITIGELPRPRLTVVDRTTECGTTHITFRNDTRIPTPDQGTFSIDFGNGTTREGFFDTITHSYENLSEENQQLNVKLEVRHLNGCVASENLSLTIPAFKEDIILPPVGQIVCFTPDKAPNEVFKVRHENLDRSFFKMSIYNQWGSEVFTTNDIEQGWDGYYNGELVQANVYVVVVEFRGCRNNRDEKAKKFTICVTHATD